MFNMYSIYDRVSGVYGDPWLCKNNELAKRRFDYVMSNSPMVAPDCQLFVVGSFDEESGLLTPFKSPVFLFNSEVKK